MLARDAQVSRRNLIPLLLQTFLQPLMFVFIFGRVMVGSGFMPATYKSLLLPGIMALSMVGTGIWAVAMPLIGEFQFTREIEDRLLAPMEISWVAIEKVVFGTMQVALFSAVGGLALGCSIDQTHIGLMFSLVVAPMIFFGCAYYPWSALNNFPIMQKIVLINPLVYASEGLRGTLVPQFPHLPMAAALAGLVFFDTVLLSFGLHRFHKKAVS
jgi:ABC-2 type transport system permease protein